MNLKLYDWLTKSAGTELAWGILTGVRPTKLMMSLIEEGMSEEEAKNIAQYNAEVAFNETQQSSRDEFVSPTQVSRNVLIKSMMNYQNSNVGYQRLGNEGLLEIMRAKHVY